MLRLSAISKYLMPECYTGSAGFCIIYADRPAKLLNQLPDDIKTQAGMLANGLPPTTKNPCVRG